MNIDPLDLCPAHVKYSSDYYFLQFYFKHQNINITGIALITAYMYIYKKVECYFFQSVAAKRIKAMYI